MEGTGLTVVDDKDTLGSSSFLLKIPLGEAAETFSLEGAVCTHGLFMMAPNHWDPLTRSLSRPLHLHHHHRRHSNSYYNNNTSSSVMVSISQPREDSRFLHLKVYYNDKGTETPSYLSEEEKETLLVQVRRMLRLSESDDRNVREFRNILSSSLSEYDDYKRGFSGRVFRSPTLFEDMVKCILLCNCQWPRTLSMARALCELQFELQHRSSDNFTAKTDRFEDFIPKTPSGRESKRKLKLKEFSVTRSLGRRVADLEKDGNSNMASAGKIIENLNPCFTETNFEDDSSRSNELSTADSWPLLDRIGNFPSPGELAKLDEKFLAKRCNLGYRAGRILKLAKGIVEERVRLSQLEEVCINASLSSYNELAEQLRDIDGFGPFTCANVLVCMGFYHVIPSDSETVRHLKQVHGRNSSIKTVQRDVEEIYGKYAPYQFLAYWSELWYFYEKRFGNLSEMPCSNYKLITASNMRANTMQKVKSKKDTSTEIKKRERGV